jgi:arylsulfatase A-like enzyme
MRILYVDCDSLRPDHLGCYGYHRNTSPTIDDLAEDGRVFTNYYASDVPCLPSRTALFSSRFGIHSGVVNHGGTNADPRPVGEDREFAMPMSRLSFPAALGFQGYRTCLVSSFPQRHGAHHVTDGFDEWRDTGGFGSERADVVYDRAEGWLDSHAEEEDWYLHVNFWDPHTPYDTPQEYGNPFEDDPAPEFPDAETITEQYAGYGPHSAHDVHHGYLTGDGPEDLERTPDEIADRADYERWVDGYDVGIRYMDDYIAKLLGRLEEAGVREETLVVVTADHGENLGELNVYGDHQTADHVTARVPLIVDGPGVEPGDEDGLYYNVDFAPTMVEYLAREDEDFGDVGADLGDDETDGESGEEKDLVEAVFDDWDGRSFAGGLTGHEEAAGRDYLVLSQGAWACQRAVRWDDYLLIRTYHDGLKQFDPVELYDLDADPHETTNLARDRTEVVREGLTMLEDWTSARLRENATDEAGGSSVGPHALEDPFWRVLAEGGPYHTNGHEETYAERLRETDREAHAEDIEERRGVVETTVVEYLAGED